MNEIVPNYYHKFHCIAERCQHSCCIGWEIDVDEATMALYRTFEGKMGERIRNSIDGNVPHFVLDEKERCPFFNEHGLCDIICAYGEEALCDICALHPRFKNFYAEFTETGLGLCCEEAARIVLFEQDPFFVALPKEIATLPEEEIFLKKREEVFAILKDRSQKVSERFSGLAERFGFFFDFSPTALLEIFQSLERLDEAWTAELNALVGFSFDKKIFDEQSFQLPFEQLAVYFVFRHLTGALFDGDYEKRVKFCLMSCYFIGMLWSNHKNQQGIITPEKMVDLVRMYSSEIEYSDENSEVLMNQS